MGIVYLSTELRKIAAILEDDWRSRNVVYNELEQPFPAQWAIKRLWQLVLLLEPQIKEQKIEELELSVRSQVCLEKHNVRIIGDLLKLTEADLVKTPNFGRKSLAEVKEVLSGLGLHLGMDENGRHAQDGH
jgi:DNA-directed RNA polymerase alpha subunit